jgi:hypothetical protein
MPFHSYVSTVSVLPHVFSRMDRNTKKFYREKYKNIKKTFTVGTMVSVSAIDGVELAKDILSSKLRAYGYKSLFAIAAGPIIQVIALPLYIFSYGSAVRKYAKAASEIGAKITTGEMGIVNWAWIGMDIMLFGEPVSITESSDLMILSNETTGAVTEVLDSFY